jgi:hypothetical protein
MNLKIASLADTKLISKVQKNVQQFIAELEKDPDIMLKYKELNAEIKKYQQLTTLN